MGFRYDLSSAGKLAASASLVGRAGYWLTTRDDGVRQFLGWCCAATAAGGLWLLTLPLRRGVQIVIDERGIEDRQTGYGLIPWSEVRGAYLTVMGRGRGKYLSVEVDHAETYVSRVPAHKRLLARANGMFPGIGKVMLNFSLLTPGPEVALSCIRDHLRQRGAAGPGRCPACGYDLRATPDRCPECGAVPKAAT